MPINSGNTHAEKLFIQCSSYLSVYWFILVFNIFKLLSFLPGKGNYLFNKKIILFMTTFLLIPLITQEGLGGGAEVSL